MKRALHLALVVAFIPVLGCSNGHKPTPDGGQDADGGNTGEVIDNCDGSEGFLPIPQEADIIFSAGIYAEAPYPDGVESPSEIYAMDLETKNIYRVSCSNFAAPTCDYGRVSLSPDRSRAVLVRGCTDSNGDQKINYLDRKSIWILDLATEDIFELQGFNAVNAPEWSANDEIVFAANTPGVLNTDIYKVDANGENLQNLTDTPEMLENDCSWSKDGSRIVYCEGIPVDPNFYPSGGEIVYSMLISVDENLGRGRWNVFSASTSGLDQDITNLTNHPTAFQDVARVSDRGIVFHETNQDAQPPFYGLVHMDQQGNNRQELLNSQWRYFVQPSEWLP